VVFARTIPPNRDLLGAFVATRSPPHRIPVQKPGMLPVFFPLLPLPVHRNVVKT
jgi:hypothetical protein